MYRTKILYYEPGERTLGGWARFFVPLNIIDHRRTYAELLATAAVLSTASHSSYVAYLFIRITCTRSQQVNNSAVIFLLLF